MSTPTQLPPDVQQLAYDAAVQEGFPEVIRILLTMRDGRAVELTAREAKHLVSFARYLQFKAELHFPYWDDSETPHSLEHEDAFHAVNTGLFEKLAWSLGMGRDE